MPPFCDRRTHLYHPHLIIIHVNILLNMLHYHVSMRGLYLGELLEHTVNMLNLVPAVCSNYPQIDQDLLATGVILHDIGKIEEYEYSCRIDVSD